MGTGKGGDVMGQMLLLSDNLLFGYVAGFSAYLIIRRPPIWHLPLSPNLI